MTDYQFSLACPELCLGIDQGQGAPRKITCWDDPALASGLPSSSEKKLAEIGPCANTKTTFFNTRF
jgi:hypothetical protein